MLCDELCLEFIYFSHIVCVFYFSWKIVSELFHT